MTTKLICIDADDTLWHNERHFQAAQARIHELLKAQPDAEARIAAAERANVPLYGFGAKGFILSVIEAAAGAGTLDAMTVMGILEVGKDLLQHPVELLDGVEEAVPRLRACAPVVLVTKGDLLHQEAKLAQSGLGQLFDAVDIVSDKTATTFTRIFDRHGVDPAGVLMIGDSLRSDILPALEAGARAAYVPHPLAWAYEIRDEPTGNPGYHRFGSLMEVVSWVEEEIRGATAGG